MRQVYFFYFFVIFDHLVIFFDILFKKSLKIIF